MPEPPLAVAVNAGTSPTVKVSGPTGAIVTVGAASTVTEVALELATAPVLSVT